MKNNFKENFEYLMSLSNKELRKEIENSNWNFILQELRYAGDEIERLEKNNESMQFEMCLTWKKLDEKEARIDKAIEFIKQFDGGMTGYTYWKEVDRYKTEEDAAEILLKILSGGDGE